MLSVKPYILKAFYDWITDCNHTPILLVSTEQIDFGSAQLYEADNELALNISAAAVRELDFSYEKVSFIATFAGVKQLIVVPMNAILAIYAEGSDQGMYFEQEEVVDKQDVINKPDGQQPILRIIE